MCFDGRFISVVDILPNTSKNLTSQGVNWLVLRMTIYNLI